MRKVCLAVAAILAFLSFKLEPAAARKLACDELKSAIVYVDTMGDILEDSRRYDPAVDRELRNLAEGAAGIALLENDEKLAKYSVKLIEAWDAKDEDRFLKYADKLADRLEAFFDRDC